MATTAILVATGLATALGTMAQAQAQSNAATFNAQQADQQATYSRQVAAENERRQRAINTKNLGTIRAKYGASGITLDGSPSDILDESAANAELEALTIRHGGMVEALGYSNSARLDRYRAGAASSAGYLGAAGDLLGSGAKITYLNRTG